MPRVYVMTCDDKDFCRVGHHTTTDIKRERELWNGQRLKWKVKSAFDVADKKTELAVEYLAQALLRDCAFSYDTNNGTRAEGYQCSWERAEEAVKKAKTVVEATLSV